MVVEELQKTTEKIVDIVDGVIRPKEGGIYNQLKKQREAAKKLLIERCERPGVTEDSIEEHLDQYMGKMGHISAKTGVAKVFSAFWMSSL